uniref:Uncharacterized protein n=1 Tax=viral metagenome TaxID=1070528 RepID=A0A6M3KF49_9ZZZZ
MLHHLQLPLYLLQLLHLQVAHNLLQPRLQQATQLLLPSASQAFPSHLAAHLVYEIQE